LNLNSNQKISNLFHSTFSTMNSQVLSSLDSNTVHNRKASVKKSQPQPNSKSSKIGFNLDTLKSIPNKSFMFSVRGISPHRTPSPRRALPSAGESSQAPSISPSQAQSSDECKKEVVVDPRAQLVRLVIILWIRLALMANFNFSTLTETTWNLLFNQQNQRIRDTICQQDQKIVELQAKLRQAEETIEKMSGEKAQIQQEREEEAKRMEEMKKLHKSELVQQQQKIEELKSQIEQAIVLGELKDKDLEQVKWRFFYSCALAIKLDGAVNDVAYNFNIQELYELAILQKISFVNWEQWIIQQIHKNSKTLGKWKEGISDRKKEMGEMRNILLCITHECN
jgi:hypothetical protein